LEALIERYTRRTSKSKELTQAYRSVWADNRASAGFRFSIKEMLYPVIGTHSSGSRVWDVDGNEYIDLTMGFGVNLFGHDAPFIKQALKEQIERGIQLGPQSDLAGPVAQLINELTGMERVAFCNSGTEAVMTALRLARTATGRAKVALFAGSYHGLYDGTLARPQATDEDLRSIPMSPGITAGAVEDVLVLDYDSPRSLEILRANVSQLAAVLVEPVQSRRPDLHPKAFLQQLRELTHEVGAALIFDEVITGFRIHPGGAQAWFGIQADLATYGKIVGGGMPIGIVAGRAVYMDGIDGGMWSYEDHSYPSATTTFFAGTFCKHPLAMAAAQAVLTHLKAEGADLQKRLNERTARLAERLNGYFVQNDVPLRVVYFGSLFRFAFTGNMDLLFYHLMEKGIYIWEGRNCFLSTAHTDEDIESVIRAVEESVEEMRAGGFMPESSKGERKPSEKVEAEPALLPMMEAQKQLWVLAQMGEDGSRAYNESLVIDIHGPLRLAAMRAAFHTVIERHDTLRMVIQPDGETQRVLPSLMVDVPLTDFSYLEQAAREEATQWLEGENHQCFDLTQGPLLRVNVLKLEEQRHLLVVTAHHIIVDGWSLGIILQEVGILYSAACQGAVCEMGSPTQFSQYIQEQEQQRQSVQMEAAESFWMERLGDSIPVLELPTSRPRPWVKTYAGARHSVTLGANLVAGLKAVARQKNCTPFMLLLAGYTALLHRLSGQDRIIVGFPVSGRVSKGFENVVGYCTHLAPVQSHVTGDPTFTQHLAHIKETLLEAYEHEYPFALLVKRLNLRDVSRSPILTTTFNLERSLDLPEMFGLEIDLVSPPIRSAKLDLCVNVTEVKGEWRIDLDYNTDLFDASAIERLAGHFCALLENIALDPGQRLSTFPLFAVGEWYKMLVEWNDTAVDYSETCIHDLVGISVERAPDAVAIVCGEQHLTLYKLDERASQLACYLQHVGVGPEIRVGVCVDRSLEMVVGLLAVLQAGGAYVPLDPAYPQARLAFMLNDAQVPVLLTLERLKPHLPVTDALVLCLDADWQRLAAENRVFVPPSVSSENLAYVIYTSGSTGEPKGVQITHAGVGNLIAWHRRVYEITTDDRATQLAGFSFDAAVWELWPYLAAGASVHIVRDEDRASALSLVNWISERRITISFFPTPLAEAALSVEWPADTSLRILLTGGDRLHSGPRQMLPFALINNYGPTENTVVSTWAPVTARDTMSPLIGRPVDNVQVYILDEHLEPVPIGAPGEIYVGGHHLARGYLNRPDLTAASFIPNPFTPPVLLRLAGRVPGGGKEVPRLYRTGDLACYLPDGNIEFLGRADDQVKVRGYRIELGEIEAVLGKHPLVREHVVVARQDASGEKRLIAYFVPQSGQAVTADDLRHFLQMQLPDYMIPSVFVELDSLPLTPNGKLDRQALPDSPALRPELAQAFVAPQSEMERTIARIWQEVLGVDQVGVYDNFFDLGGHSMHIVRAHTKLQEVLGQDFPVVEMFRYPTINGLAKCLMQAPEGLSMDKVRQRVRKQIEGLNRQAGPGRGATR
jgi:amino acid adenylation domain-containing protein